MTARDAIVGVCFTCDGSGVEIGVEMACCGNYLNTGECCAAIHGTANLVAVPQEAQCSTCGGRGEVELL